MQHPLAAATRQGGGFAGVVAARTAQPLEGGGARAGHVNVAVRVRPLNTKELNEGDTECWVRKDGNALLEFKPQVEQVGDIGGGLRFAPPSREGKDSAPRKEHLFDYVFGTGASTREVYVLMIALTSLPALAGVVSSRFRTFGALSRTASRARRARVRSLLLRAVDPPLCPVR